MHNELVFVALFGVATAVSLLARWLRVPYTVALVVAGLVLGSTRALAAPHLTKDLLYAVFLPGLLFEAAFHLEFRKFWQNKLAIHALAIPGVAAAIGLTALMLTPVASALHFVEGFHFSHGLVFAALIAATDPIAVVGLFKSLGAPKRLAVLVEGESLLNDGTAVVFVTLIVGLVDGHALSVSAALLDFARVVGMGLAIGAAIGFAVSKIIEKVDDPMVEITLTTIAAYGSFLVAEQFHYSGVIATVTAGMLCGNYAAHVGMSPSTRIAVESFWEYVTFALNSFVFLLIGFEVRVPTLLASYKPILVAYLAVTLGRAVVIYAVSLLLRRTNERIPWRWSAVLTWGGLRGGLSMVLALALPASFPHRELLVTMTYGVVILSILVQGITMAPMLRWLGLVGGGEGQHGYERARGALRAAQAGLATLERLGDDPAHKAALEPLREQYRARVRAAEEALAALREGQTHLVDEERRAALRQALQVEKDAVLAALRKGELGQEAFDELLGEVDARLVRLEQGESDELVAALEHDARARAEGASVSLLAPDAAGDAAEAAAREGGGGASSAEAGPAGDEPQRVAKSDELDASG